MPANWLKEQLTAARKEIEGWPEWKKREFEAENEHLKKEPKSTSEPKDKITEAS